MYKLTETEVLTQPSQYIDENNINRAVFTYETTEGDGGYLDSFNALKQQIDYNYVQYKEQLRTLVDRKKAVDDDYSKAARRTLMVALTPVAIFLLMQLMIPLGLKNGLFAGIYVLLRIVLLGSVVICEFYLLPSMIKDTENHRRQKRILNSDKYLQKYRAENKIISFEDEKRFLKRTISEFDQFYELVAIEGLDKKDGNLGGLDNDVLTDDQKKVLEKMRSMSVFKDYRASVIETKREVGFEWVLIGFGILIGGAVVIISFVK